MTHSSTSSHWYFTKEELIQAYGADYKAEVTARRTTVAFLQEAGIKLRQPQLTIATAIVFFHRFFVRHGLRDYDPYIIATTCLFLAGKVEETPKKLRDVILVTHRLRNKNAEDLKQDSKEFWELKELILSHERTVLQTIAFDLTIEHPYKFLLTYVKNIQGNRNLAQVAWNFVNDSLRTNLCLQYKPQFIASAAIYLASKFLKYTLAPDGKKAWWEVLDAKIDELEDISNQILDLYDSSPNLNTLGAAGEAGGYGSGSFFGPTTPPHPQLPAPTGHHTSSHHSHSRSTHSQHSSHHQYPPPPPSDPPPPPPPDHPPPPPPPSLPPPPPPSGPPPPPPSSAPPPPPPDGQSPLKPSNGLTRTPNAPATPTSSIPPPPRSSRSRSPSPRRSPRRGSRSPRRYSRSPPRRSRSPSRRSRSPRRSSRSPRRSPRRSRSPGRRGGSRSPRRSRSRSPPRRRSPYRHDRDGGRDRGGYYRRDNNNRYRY